MQRSHTNTSRVLCRAESIPKCISDLSEDKTAYLASSIDIEKNAFYKHGLRNGIIAKRESSKKRLLRQNFAKEKLRVIKTNIITEIAIALVEQIAPNNHLALIKRINRGLLNIEQQLDVELLLHPSDFLILSTTDSAKNISLISSDNISPGNFILRTAKGCVFSDLKGQILKLFSSIIVEGDNCYV